MSMEKRQIDITREDIRCCGDIQVNDDNINMTYELWFDVDKYFGTDTRHNDSVWINFYTNWYPDGNIIAFYVIDKDDSCDEYDWELTAEEKEFFRKKMETYCMQESKLSLRELWDKCND